MSFILDALKKSEIERQRQTMPGLVESGSLRPRARLPNWAIALCALLAVNLVVLSVVLVRGRISTPGTPTTQTMPSSAAPSTAGPGRSELAARQPAAAVPFSPLDGGSIYAPEIPVASNALSQGPGRQAMAPTDVQDGAGPRSARRHDPVLTDDDYKASDEEVLPSINELSLTGEQALPELHLDVHVFATKAAERFVYINMRKYHEGATLQEGPTLERIRRDGVILDYQGLRFVLPRQ